MQQFSRDQKSNLGLLISSGILRGEQKSPIPEYQCQFENSSLSLSMNVFQKKIYLHLRKPGGKFTKQISLTEAEALSMFNSADKFIRELRMQRNAVDTLYPEADLEIDNKDDIPTIPLTRETQKLEERARQARRQLRKTKTKKDVDECDYVDEVEDQGKPKLRRQKAVKKSAKYYEDSGPEEVADEFELVDEEGVSDQDYVSPSTSKKSAQKRQVVESDNDDDEFNRPAKKSGKGK